MAKKALGDVYVARVQFGQHVRQIREQQGLSQEQLADQYRTQISGGDRMVAVKCGAG